MNRITKKNPKGAGRKPTGRTKEYDRIIVVSDSKLNYKKRIEEEAKKKGVSASQLILSYLDFL